MGHLLFKGVEEGMFKLKLDLIKKLRKCLPPDQEQELDEILADIEEFCLRTEQRIEALKQKVKA